jgi:hypothetical protein
LSDEDLASVIVYLRSLAPVRRAVPKTELIFPVKYLIRSAPPYAPAPRVYRGLTDEDLKSMFAYVRAVPAVAHRVDNSKPLTACKRCNFTHGAGEQN